MGRDRNEGYVHDARLNDTKTIDMIADINKGVIHTKEHMKQYSRLRAVYSLSQALLREQIGLLH